MLRTDRRGDWTDHHGPLNVWGVHVWAERAAQLAPANDRGWRDVEGRARADPQPLPILRSLDGDDRAVTRRWSVHRDREPVVDGDEHLLTGPVEQSISCH